MKRSLLVLIAMWVTGGAFLEARPVDFSTPNNAFGAANPFGYLRIWREIGEIDYGNGLSMPIRLEFSSEYEKPSPYFGKGWSCPLLESKVYLSNEKLMAARLPCGKMMYLRRDKKDPTKFFTLDKEWTAKVEEEKITISRDDGWELRYVNGRLRQLKTDGSRILTWVSRGDLISEVREEGKGAAPFRVEATSTGQPIGFNVAGKAHTFEMGKRPKVEIANGANVIGGFEPTLTEWKWPNGTSEKYEFAVNEKVLPNLKVTDVEHKQEDYSWDPVSKHILSEGEWSYRVGQMSKESTVPKLYRSNAKGEEEFLFIMTKQGTTERKSLEDGHIITEVFKSAGPLYDKVRSVQKVAENGELQPLYKASYDESGKLIRETGNAGLTKLFTYDKQGKLSEQSVLPIRDEAMMVPFIEKEKALLEAITNAPDNFTKDERRFDLAMFYIGKIKDPKKALALTAEMSNRRRVFTIQAMAVNHDPSLNYAQKINGYQKLLTEFPEKTALLQGLIVDSERIMKSTANLNK